MSLCFCRFQPPKKKMKMPCSSGQRVAVVIELASPNLRPHNKGITDLQYTKQYEQLAMFLVQRVTVSKMAVNCKSQSHLYLFGECLQH